MKQIDFEKERILTTIFYSTFPMLVAQLLTLMYNIVDRIYIGKIPNEGVLALSGVGICFPISTIIIAFANLFGQGGVPICAIERGKKNFQKAENIMNTSFRLLVFMGFFLTGALFYFSEPILYLFGATENIFEYANSYYKIYILGVVFTMITLGMNPYINAQGFPKIGMLTIFIGTVTNLIMDPIFIFKLNLGVKGAAIATVISQILSSLFVFKFLSGNLSELKLRKKLIYKKNEICEIISLGSISFIMQITNSLVQMLSNNILGIYGGDIYITIMLVINSIRQVLDVPISAITEGISPILSYNYGAKNYKNMKNSIIFMTAISLLYTVIVWLLILKFPKLFIGIFSDDREVLNSGVTLLKIYFNAFIFQALMYSSQAVFRALKKKRQAIFFSILRKVIIIVPLIIYLPKIESIGIKGVFLAEPISNFLGGSVCFITMLITIFFKLKEKK